MTDNTALAPRDANGTMVGIGDRVQILSIPNWLIHDLPTEDQTRIKAFERRVVSIAEIDGFGYLWFAPPASGFCLRPSEVHRV